MATGKSGSFSGSSSNGGYTLRVDWTENYDVASNTSTISWKAYLVTKSGYDIYVNSKSGSVTIAGTKYTFTASVSNGGNATTLLGQGTSYSIGHNTDGTKSISMSAQWASGISACGTLSASGSGTLTTIPRASSVSAKNATMGGTCAITITRASSGFKHQLYYSFNGSALTWLANNVDTSYSWTVPTSLASSVPNSTYGTLTITCYTYSGNTKIGTSTTTCYLYVPSYSVTGTHTLTPIDQLSNKYVATKSKVNVVTAGSTSYGATIKSYSTVVGSQAAQSGATITSNALSAETIVIKTTITDSRGKTGTVTTNISVVAYSAPYCTELHAVRDETDSEKVIVTAKFGVSAIENANSISAVITISGTEYPVEVSGYTYDGTIILNGINDEVLLTGTLTVTDVYGSTAAEFAIPTLEAIMNFKSNHKGVAFGGVSQTDRAVEMYWKLFLQDAENNEMVDVLAKIKNLSNPFPVGSIYMSVNSTNPATLFGGTWERIQDRFLLAAGSSYTAGKTGGSADAIVPYHTHTFTGSAVTSGTQSANHYHTFKNALIAWTSTAQKGTVSLNGGSTEKVGWIGTDSLSASYTNNNSANHTHSVTAKGSNSYAGSSGNTTGANMPPYIAVYIWKRTA